MKEKELFKEAERLLSAFKESPEDKRRAFLRNRIDRLDVCIHELESTANQYYSPIGKGLKGWNLLLASRDKLVKLRDKDWREVEKLLKFIH